MAAATMTPWSRKPPGSPSTCCKTLIWFETHASMLEAIQREKQIKRWRRTWKLTLIETENPQWRDLSAPWFEAPDGPLSWMQQQKRLVAKPPQRPSSRTSAQRARRSGTQPPSLEDPVAESARQLSPESAYGRPG